MPCRERHQLDRGSSAAPGEETVRARIVGRPHDLVRADVARQHGNAPSTGSKDTPLIIGSLQFQLAELLHVGAAGAEDIADIGTAGQVTHPEPQQPALELEVLAHASDPHCLAVSLRRSSDGLEGGTHPLVRV